MAVPEAICVLLPEVVDRGRFTGQAQLKIPLGLFTGRDRCRVHSLKVIQLEPMVSSGRCSVCRQAVAQIEVQVLCGSRLLICRNQVVVQSDRLLRGGPGARFLAYPCTPSIDREKTGRGEMRITLAGTEPGDQFGFSIAFVGDVDGDGISDLAVGAPGASPAGLTGAGSLFLYSGANGNLIRRIDGTFLEEAFGFAVAAAGDIDGDGVPDILVGAPGPDGSTGSAFVISGADGTILFSFPGEAAGDQFGWAVAGVGDVNGDSVPDLLIGAPSADPGALLDAGSAYLFSGATGLLLNRFDGTSAGEALGFAVATPGDVNGDGVPDLLLGASQASPGGNPEAGRALLFSSTFPYPLLLTLNGGAAGDGLGWVVGPAGDVDGDGVPDLLVGAPGADPGGRIDAGSLLIYSGATGTPLRQVDGQAAGESLGVAAVSVDLNADGTPELLVGSPDAGPGFSVGRADLYLNAGAALFRSFRGVSRYNQFGWSVAADGNSKTLAIGAPVANPGGLEAAGTVDLILLAALVLELLVCVEVDVLVEAERQISLGAVWNC